MPSESADLEIRCACGAFRGSLRGVSPRTGNRGVCYCGDCQSFAWFLDREREVLDAHGGTDIFQTSPARVAFSEGSNHLACIQLTPRLLRWYASCCNTPVGNTMPSGGVPFVGLIHSCLRDPDEARGPVRSRVFGQSARGDLSEVGGYDRFPVGSILRLVTLIAGARLRGDQKRSPFFDPETLAPRVAPRLLTDDERFAVESRRDAQLG